VTRQYLDYVEQIRRRNLELASEYLLMAAMLIEIKSRMLLPPKKTADGGEAEDPRAELVRRLLEYEQMKLAAAKLDALPVLGRDFLRAQVHIEQAWRAALARRARRRPARGLAGHPAARQAQPAPQDHREQLSVREHMSIVLRGCRAGASWSSTTCSTRPRGVPRAGGDLHRDARAVARAPAGSDAGRSLRADLRAAGVHAQLKSARAAARQRTLPTSALRVAPHGRHERIH
jgi:segregation and condensation protein A